MTEARLKSKNIREAIKAVALDAEDLEFLNRTSRLPLAAQRAHGVLVAPLEVAFFHACGHTSWIDYGAGKISEQVGEAGLRMLLKSWNWRRGGVTGACHQCSPKRRSWGTGSRKIHNGPDWRPRGLP